MSQGYIALRDLGHGFEEQDLFHGLDMIIQHDDRIGIIGPNGAGKSTLFDIITGRLEPREGKVELVGQLLWAMVKQRHEDVEKTLWEAMESALEHLAPLKEKMQLLEEQMSQGAYNDATLEEYAEVQEQYTNLGGYTVHHQIHQIFTGLKLPKQLWEGPVSHLSSGQRTKLALGQVLLQSPDMMLLDEPTNYLDMESMEWLEHFLNTAWKGGFLIISHDRYFLDRTSKITLEMIPGNKPEYYGSPYHRAMEEREKRIKAKHAAYESAYTEQLRQEEIVRRLRAGSRASLAQSRMKQLDKMELPEKPHIQPIPHITLRKGNTPPDILLSIRDLCIGYDKDHPLYFASHLQVRPGERIAIMGPNGAGKTTLLKTLLGELKALDGMFQFGRAVQHNYYSQDYRFTREDHSILEELHIATEGYTEEELRKWLGRYLFVGDEVHKYITVLSGGERARVALAILSMTPSNLLLLDEPTNHLDYITREALEDALVHYKGSLLFISHDRYFIDKIATHLWIIDPNTGELYVRHGNYTENKYREDRGDFQFFSREHEMAQLMEVHMSKGGKKSK